MVINMCVGAKIMLKVVRLDEKVDLPTRATDGSAGYELQYAGDKQICLLAGEKAMLPTGLKIHIANKGVVAFILPRSKKGTNGLVLKNLVGVVDSDYTGQWYISAWNSNKNYKDCNHTITIEPYEKIAQVVFVKLADVAFELVDSLEQTERNDGGISKSVDTKGGQNV